MRLSGSTVRTAFLCGALTLATVVSAADSGDELEEVVVTAQKRSERLQDVPISVQVISGQMRIEQNINGVEALTQTTPAVFATTAGRSTQIDIRGIGSGVSQVFDQSVGTYIDDVYHGRTRATGATFLDIESIEILKGPQSTYFGNNSIAGAFNILTRKPSDVFEASARIGYSPEANQYVTEAAVGGPITETVSARLAATSNGQSGYVLNTNTNEKQPQEDNQAARLTVLYKPYEDLDITAKVEATRNNNESGLFLNIVDCPPASPFIASGYCSAALASGHYSPDTTMDIAGQREYTSTADAAVTVNYHRWGHTFTAVSGYYKYNFELYSAFDAVPVNQITSSLPEHYSQFSQEFRVASPTGQTIEYLAGMYFQTDQLHYQSDINYYILNPVFESTALFAPLVPYLPLDPQINYGQQEHDYSVFGAATWNVTDRVKVIAGIRGSQVNKAYSWNQVIAHPTSTFDNAVPLPPNLQALAGLAGLGSEGNLSGSRSDRAWMPSGKLTYKITPDAMAYLSYSKGFKAGGFNGNDTTGEAANLPFKPEYVNAYEAGLKSEWFDHRVLTNVAIFRSNYRDLQLVSDLVTAGSTGFTSFVKNAGAARSQGVELESQWQVNHDFRLSANASYLDSIYTRYPNVPATALQQLQGLTIQDLSGRPTQFAPEWSGNVTATYGFDLPREYRLTTELNTFITSSYFNSESNNDDPLQLQHGYYRADGRITLETPDKHWAFDLIGKNLNDNRRIIIWSSNLPFSLGSMYEQFQQGRYFTLQARYHY